MQNNLLVKIREIVARHFGIDPERLTDDARFQEDLGADWLDRLELLITIEDEISGFEIADVVAEEIDTVGDLLRTVVSRDLRISVVLKSQIESDAKGPISRRERLPGSAPLFERVGATPVPPARR